MAELNELTINGINYTFEDDVARELAIAEANRAQEAENNKVDKVVGKGLSTNDYTNAEKEKLAGLENYNETIKNLPKNYAKKSGVENDLVSGAAKTLLGNTTVDREFTSMVMDGADGLAEINEVKGNSLVWNQLVQNGNFADGTNKWNFGRASGVVSNNEITIKSGENPATTTQIAQPINTLSGHKYYFSFYLVGIASERLLVLAGGSFPIIQSVNYTSKTSGDFSNIFTAESSFGLISFYPNSNNTVAANTELCKLKNIVLIDLTLMFGEGNEPSTVEEFEAMFPLPYYEYNEGEIISNATEKLEVTGFNQWDEEWEVGEILASTGENYATIQQWRSKNYIPILPNSYYYSCANGFSNKPLRPRFYDANFTYIGYQPQSGNTNIGNIFKTPIGARYMRFALNVADVPSGTYICINLSDTNKNGTYEPYKHKEVVFNLSSIMGKLNGEGESVAVFPDGMRSAGTVFDFLVVDEDGFARKAIVRMVSVDMGELNWKRLDNGTFFYADEIVGNVNIATAIPNALCPKYTAARGDIIVSQSTVDKSFGFSSSQGRILLRDTSYSDPAVFKTAMSGVPLIYELAEYKEYVLDTPIPMTFQAYHNGVIHQDPQAPDSAPMKMNMTFALDAVGTLNNLPKDYISAASIDAFLAQLGKAMNGTWTKTWNDNTGEWDFSFTPNAKTNDTNIEETI